MQVRAPRVVGLAVTLAAGLLVAAPAVAGPQPTHEVRPQPSPVLPAPQSPRPEFGVPPGHPPGHPPGYPPGNPPSCLIPAGSPMPPTLAPTPIQPEPSCQLPEFCLRPAVDRRGLTTCGPQALPSDELVEGARPAPPRR